jgi:hypothetical protein
MSRGLVPPPPRIASPLRRYLTKLLRGRWVARWAEVDDEIAVSAARPSSKRITVVHLQAILPMN